MKYLGISILTATSAFVGVFIFYIAGCNEELLQPRIEIIIPEGFTGLVCATSRPGSIENKDEIAHFNVERTGIMYVEGDILRSHRKIKYYEKSNLDGELRELPDDYMFGIYTEGDHVLKISYGIFWVGSPAGWEQFRKITMGNPRCLGRNFESNDSST